MSTDGSTNGVLHERYRRRMQEIRAAFDAGATGAATIAARARALDEFAGGLWAREVERDRRLSVGISLIAIGGYGRAQLFPYSDVDLLFLLDGRLAEKDVKDAIRRVNQEMWDAGIRISPATRRLAECERFDAENAEFAISLMDHRPIAGDAALYKKLARQTVPKMLQRERRELMSRLVELTQARHAKYGRTIFHLEPNIKDCPGGLRDVHVWDWMTRLRAVAAAEGNSTAGGSRGRRARPVSRGGRVSLAGAVLSALSARARRQCARLARAGCGRGAWHWHGRRRACRGRCGVLDAVLFSPCPAGRASCRANA